MPETLSILDRGERKFFTVSEHGISFRPATPQGIWLETVQQLCGMFEGAEMTRQKALMLLADAMNYGQDEYGEEHAQAIDGMREALGLTPKTISNAQWAYGKIEPERRKSGLTLGHFIVLASLPPKEQDVLMVTAIDEHMSVDQLKEHVAEVHPKTKRGTTRKAAATASTETAETALQKLIAVSNFLSDQPDAVNEKWKGPLEKLYKVYRRNWQSGKAKK